jgi:Ni,Fe-hydrogenase III large subunit
MRTLLLELERLYNHLHDIGQLCAGVGFAAGTMAFLSLKERAQRLNERLTGHRFLFDTVAVGHSPAHIRRDARQEARHELRGIGESAATAWREILFNGSVQDRLGGIGVVRAAPARSLGTVGPAARASGVGEDARSGSRHLSYDGFVPAEPERPTGDVRARLELRALELAPTLVILDELLGRSCDGADAAPGFATSEIGLGRVESPRGETICIVEHDEGTLTRLRLRTASYANWPSVAHAATDELLPDFPLINKSFELCYACADR